MEVTKALLLVCLLTVSLLAQFSLTAPVTVEREDDTLQSGVLTAERARRAVGAMEQAAPELLSDSSSSTDFLSRMRRSMAQMYNGSMHYNSHRRRGGRTRHHRRRYRHHRRHRGRVVDA